jgi:hypothetical protein
MATGASGNEGDGISQKESVTDLMDILEILENPGVAVRVCGFYRGLLVVVKLFGSSEDQLDRSIKFYEMPERFIEVKSRWNTNQTVPLSDPRAESYIQSAQEYLMSILVAVC